jgi:nucleoside-diphosphate-sugar epimerase
MVGRLSGREVSTVHGAYPTRAHDTRIWLADNRRARAELGWAPSVGLEAGLKSTIAWHRAHVCTE